MKAKIESDGPDTVVKIYGAERESHKMTLKEASEQDVASVAYRDGELTLTFKPKVMERPVLGKIDASKP